MLLLTYPIEIQLVYSGVFNEFFGVYTGFRDEFDL